MVFARTDDLMYCEFPRLQISGENSKNLMVAPSYTRDRSNGQ
jgi:hypothetical protein